MNDIEVDYFEDLQCPFCQKVIVDSAHEDEPKICSHTIFVATDDGFEYIREDLKVVIIDKSVEIFDDYTKNLKLKGAVRRSQYSPAPFYFGAYFGFLE